MNPAFLKREFGERLAFHGGYILASSHHIQADTPVENILAMYDLDLR